MKRIDELRVEVEQRPPMKVAARIMASHKLLIEPQAVQQLRDAASVPPVYRALAMPDIHQGYGVPIGCVLALDNAVMPAAVGYDVNCGMRVIKTEAAADEVDVRELAHAISRDIPLGEGRDNLRLPADALEAVLAEGVAALPRIAGCSNHRVWEVFDAEEVRRDATRIEDGGSMAGDPSAVSDHAKKRGASQLGTLGGGNHFGEIQRVEKIFASDLADALGLFEGQLLVMLHSGSRGLGHQVGDEYMKLAEQFTFDQVPNKMLCYLPADSREGRRYIAAMNAAANFAFANREIMAILARRNLRHYLGKNARLELLYDVPHNMAKLETHGGKRVWVHRKGTTRAFGPSRMADEPFNRTGQPVIIPGSMGTGSYVLTGRDGNDETLCSVNHGAGRTMSRSAARGRRGKPGAISDSDFDQAMRGIELIAGNRSAVKEEAPQAYKDIDEVIRVVREAELANVVAKVRPLAVMKG